jgi:hypothetical protein
MQNLTGLNDCIQDLIAKNHYKYEIKNYYFTAFSKFLLKYIKIFNNLNNKLNINYKITIMI